MPIESFIIALAGVIAIFVVLPTIIIRGITNYKLEERKGADGVSMKELEQLVEQAVFRANAPLQEQMNRLEARLDRLEPPPERKLLEGGAIVDEARAEVT